MRQHSINSINRLVGVFPEPDSVIDPEVVRRAGEIVGEREAAAEQQAFRVAFRDHIWYGPAQRRVAAQHRPEPFLAIGREPVMPVAVEHRPVKARHAGTNGHRLMQGRDVTEPDDRPRIRSDGVVIDPIEDPMQPVPATREKEAIELRRTQTFVDDRHAFVITAREITIAMRNVRHQRDTQSARPKPLSGDLDSRKFGW